MSVEVPVYDFKTHSRRTDEVRAGRQGGKRTRGCLRLWLHQDTESPASGGQPAAHNCRLPPNTHAAATPRCAQLPPPPKHTRRCHPQVRKVEPTDVVIVEGILVGDDARTFRRPNAAVCQPVLLAPPWAPRPPCLRVRLQRRCAAECMRALHANPPRRSCMMKSCGITLT